MTHNATWCQNRGCICISSVRRTYGRIHMLPAYIQSSRQAPIILWTELFPKKRREKIQGEILQSIFEYRIQWCFQISQELQCFHTQSNKFPVILCYSTYRINTSTKILQEILQLQGSSRAVQYKSSSSDCSRVSKHSTWQNKTPAPLQVFQGHTAQAGFQQFYPVETAF